MRVYPAKCLQASLNPLATVGICRTENENLYPLNELKTNRSEVGPFRLSSY